MNYDVDHLIAEGGTARVYWGVDKRSGFPVAIKELKVEHMKNIEVREKFRKMETQLMLYAQHPNIPKLIDFIDLNDSSRMFLIMEYVQGRSLEKYIHEEVGIIPQQKALPIFLEILDAIGFLHKVKIRHLGITNGVLHCDIKSNNVMLQPDGHVKIIDLGIASRMDESNTGFGTPAYMPPEQYKESKIPCGRYTDIFALGVMLFEMLTGNLPFSSNNPIHSKKNAEIRDKVEHAPVPQMSQYYPFISPELQTIVEKALEKDPQQRYQSCEEFAEDIIDFMNNNDGIPVNVCLDDIDELDEDFSDNDIPYNESAYETEFDQTNDIQHQQLDDAAQVDNGMNDEKFNAQREKNQRSENRENGLATMVIGLFMGGVGVLITALSGGSVIKIGLIGVGAYMVLKGLFQLLFGIGYNE